MSNTPQVRFADYSGDWEQRKLAKLVDFSKGYGYSKGDLEDSGNPIILYGRLYTNYKTEIYDVDTFVNAKPGSVYSRGGEVIVPASGETAEDISIASVVIREGIILGGDLNVITPARDLDSMFLALSISYGKPHDDMAKMAQGKSVVHLHNSDLEKIDLTYPIHEEQAKISSFFRRLDSIITLHQSKLEKLKNVKKSCLEKMFPKNGSKYPEVRFKGFTDDWEQRKLGDLSESFEYGLNAAAKEYDGENKYIRITDINDDSRIFMQDNVTSPDADLSNADNYKLKEGDILFARTGASVGKSYIYKDFDGLVYYAGFLIRVRIKPEYDAEYVFQNTLTSDYEKYIRITSQRSGQPGVNAQEYAELPIMVPSLEEQKKIGSFLRQLDNTITLHQRKLEKLKQFKQAMLHNMFV